MKKKENKRSLNLIIIAFIVGICILLVFTALRKKPQELSQQYVNKPSIQNDQFVTYTSKDLKVSFQYPRGWYVDEKDYGILITSYITYIGANEQPNNKQLRIDIDRFTGCHKAIEDNLMDPACGEGGPSVAKNKIVSKEIKQTKEGVFYKYIISTPKGNELTYYLLEKGDKVLQLSKQPDPSQFEKEFDDIINSITFL